MKIRARFVIVPSLCVAVAASVVLFVTTLHKPLAFAQRKNMLAVARAYPNYTLEQRMAVLRERQNELHPKWRDASMEQIAALIARYAASSTTGQAPLAGFVGNVTAITAPPGDVLAMARESDCTLTMDWASYTLSLPTISYTAGPLNYHYDQVLHSAAGLTTTGGAWPAGCGDPTLGIPSRSLVPLGINTSGLYGGVGVGYNPTAQEPIVYSVFIDSLNGSNISPGLTSIPNTSPLGAAAGDFNGDGNADFATINEAQQVNGTASVSVFLTNSNGSLQSPVSYTLPGTQGDSLVVDDFNGDGKLDIVATSTEETSSPFQITRSLSFLAGKGDGTFAAPVSVTLSTITSGTGPEYYGLVSADLLNNGKKDLVSSDGYVLFGNGDGTFTAATTTAFPSPTSTSEFSPDVVAADFNKDGKMDLAVDNGESIQTYLGNGDGTFTAGPGYATIDNTGYLNAADLDGDGNVDLYSGTARAGIFAGDQFEPGQAYALMGHGDGTFAGAPTMPFAYTGSNLEDLNGDHIPDGVGVNTTINTTNVSLTSYLGRSNGTFTAAQTFAISPITLSGTTYNFASVDSIGIGDVNGDGKPDLVYLVAGFYGPGGAPGFFLATGNGDGTFNAPTFVPFPSLYPNDAGQVQASSLFVADLNGDGKADIVYSYTDTSNSTIYNGLAVQYSNGDGTFKSPVLLQAYSGTGANPITARVAALGDTRADGRTDILAYVTTTTTTSNGISVSLVLNLALNNGDGTTPPIADNPNLPSFGSGIGQVALADMNGDGKPDLVTLGSTANDDQAELAVSLGNGDGTFQKPAILDFGNGSSEGYGLAVGDFSGDGKMDVAVTGFDPPIDTGIFVGNGDGTVQTFSPSSGLVEPSEAIDLLTFGAAQALDFNGDGKVDLIAGQAILLNGASTGTSSGGGSGGGSGTANFALTASASSLSVSPGGSGNLTLTVTPQNGFNQPVSFSCSGLPSEAACSFSPTSVTPAGTSPASGTVTVTTTAASSAELVWPLAGGGCTAAFALFFFRRKRTLCGAICLVALAVLSGVTVGCGGNGGNGGNGGSGGGGGGGGGNPGTPSGNSTVTVTATAGALSHTATFTLTVQ